MNSPDTTRLAAALAKLDDPEIITLLLEVVLPKQMTDTRPDEPVQQELLGHIQTRSNTGPDRSAPNAKRNWTQNQIYQLRAMHHGGASFDEMAQRFGRSRRSVETAIQRHVLKNPRYQHRGRR